MKKPKIVKPILIGVACTIPIGLVVGLSVNWDHTQYISAVGSSGVKPFIEKFGKTYRQSHKKFDVTVESGGTTFAIEQIAKGYTTIGDASNNPYKIINDQGFLEDWGNKKTLTLGWEGLCLMYSLPKELSQEAKDHFDVVISKDNILKLYGVFSCWHELKDKTQWDPIWESIWYYASEQSKEWFTRHGSQDDINLLKNTKILPFVRAGGNTGANSSIAFTYYSNLAEFEDMSFKQQKAFAGGQYGDDGDFIETDESNTRAWQSFVAKDKPGSMVYLTSSFLAHEENRKEIKDRGYKLALYLPKPIAGRVVTPQKIETTEDLKNIATVGGYNWYRPINVMIDLDVEKAKDFVYWIYFNTDDDLQTIELSKQYEDLIYSLGARPLTVNQFESMINISLPTIKQSLFDSKSSDLEIAKDRIDYSNVYGAIDWWKDE